MKNSFFNVKLSNFQTKENFIQILRDEMLSGFQKELFFFNANCFNIAQKDADYLEAINTCDYLLNDGIGVKIGSFFCSAKIGENLNGTDLIPMIFDIAIERNLKIFLLGSKDGIAKEAKEKLEENYENLNIVGTHSGYFDDSEKIVELIKDSGADILIVGMGVPKQELWIKKYKYKIPNVKLFIAGGAILDFFSEHIKRAPFWMRLLCIEWVFRLLQEPKRLWKRYLIGNFIFFIHIFAFKMGFKPEVETEEPAGDEIG